MESASPDPVLKKPRPSLVRRLLPLVGLAMAVFFVSRLDVGAMVDVVRVADPRYVVVASLLMATNTVLKGVRWYRLLRAQPGAVEQQLGLSDTSWMFVEAVFLGSFTIGRIGEFVRVSRLHDRGVAVSVGLASCLVDRGLDLAALVVIGAACAAFLSAGIAAGAAVAALGIAATFVGAAVARVVVKGAENSGTGFVDKARRMVRSAAFFALPKVLAEAMLWTLLAWSFAFGVVICLARALSLQASAVSLTAAHAISGISTLLPFTWQGVGTRELIFAAILGKEGITGPQAVVLAELTFVVMLLTGTWMGLLEWAGRGRRLKSGDRADPHAAVRARRLDRRPAAGPADPPAAVPVDPRVASDQNRDPT